MDLSSIEIHSARSDDPRVRVARFDWADEDSFCCLTCERRHQADDAALIAAGVELLDGHGRQLHEDSPSRP